MTKKRKPYTRAQLEGLGRALWPRPEPVMTSAKADPELAESLRGLLRDKRARAAQVGHFAAEKERANPDDEPARWPDPIMMTARVERFAPSGHSTPDRSALTREPSDTPSSYATPTMEFSNVECVCGQTMVKRAGHDCKCLNCGELVGEPSFAQRVFEAAGEHDTVVAIDGVPKSRREMCLMIAEARRRLGQDPPKCDHGKLSALDQLCLECGEYTRFVTMMGPMLDEDGKAVTGSAGYREACDEPNEPPRDGRRDPVCPPDSH